MDEEKLKARIEKLEQMKSAIASKMKINDRKLKIRRHIEIGALATKFGLETFDNETLMGAFAEIKAKADDPKTLDSWKQNGSEQSTRLPSPVIVSFAKDPGEELKKALKYVRDLAAEGQTILLVGTTKQSQEAILEAANKCGMP